MGRVLNKTVQVQSKFARTIRVATPSFRDVRNGRRIIGLSEKAQAKAFGPMALFAAKIVKLLKNSHCSFKFHLILIGRGFHDILYSIAIWPYLRNYYLKVSKFLFSFFFCGLNCFIQFSFFAEQFGWR